MAAPSRVTDARRNPMMPVFALTGLLSGLLVIPLGYFWMPLVFACEGILFGVGFALSYAACRRLLPRIGVLRFGGALFVFAIGYPVAIAFGGALSLASQFLLQATIRATPALQDSAPLTILGFMLFWGSLSAALFVNIALTLVTCEWDNRALLLLALAGVFSAAVSFGFYLLFYDSPDPIVTRYRELALFGVMAPVGNAAFGAVCAYAIMRAEKAGMAAVAASAHS